MTNDALSVVSLIFTTIWSIFTSWHIPGTNVTPAAFSLFSLLVVAIIKLIRYILDINKE